jgi:N-acetylglucosamine-6-sulfatase
MRLNLVLTALAVLLGTMPAPAHAQTRPNVVLIVGDDIPQSDIATLVAQGKLPNIKALQDSGVVFTQAISSGSVGSTARISLLTGQYAQNHKEFGADLFYGGPVKHNEATLLPNWLRTTGYITGKVGRTIPGYGAGDLTTEELAAIAAGHPTATVEQLRLFYSTFPKCAYIPPGWSIWFVFCEPSTWSVHKYKVSINGTKVDFSSYNDPVETFHQTDFVAYSGDWFIRSMAQAPTTPWFLELAPVAYNRELWPGPDVYNVCPDSTHPQAWWFGGTYWGLAERPPLRHLNTIWNANDPDGVATASDAFPFPMSPSFDEADVSDKPRWVQNLPRISAFDLDCVQKRYWRRLETVKSVDDLVGTVMKALEETGQLANTHVVFMSDNGNGDGQHRYNEKLSAYEDSLRIPLIWRRAGTTTPVVVDKLVLGVDIAPTIAAIAGATPNIVVDGRSLLPLMDNPGLTPWRKMGLLQHTLGVWDGGEATNAPREYYGLRIGNGNPRLFLTYPTAQTGVRGEYYKMATDPDQLNNLYGTATTEVTNITPWLSLMKVCKGNNPATLYSCAWLENNFNR